MDLAGLLSSSAPGVVTSDSPVDRLSYARDLWPRHHLDIRSGHMLEGSRPAMVVWPTTTEEVSSIVRACAGEGIPVVPFGAGSGVCAGVLPHPKMVVLDLKKMTRWRSLDAESRRFTVEAGAMGITLEEQLQRRGHTLGHFPSSILCSTVGGWLAARGAGQCSGRYGKIEDMVADIELVDGKGDVVTLHRRTEGPDLVPLVIGSEGTLGVITATTMRLNDEPTARAFVAFSFPTIEAGWTAMRALFQAGLRPAVSRLYDPFDSFIAKMGSVKRPAKKKKSAGGGIARLAPVLRVPKILNALIDGPGERFLGGSTLVLVFEGAGAEPHDDVARATELCIAEKGRPLGDGPARRWYAHRYSVSYRQAPVFRAGAFSDTMEVASPWSRLDALYHGVKRALGEHVFVMAHLSHAYPDGCSIYFTFAGNAENDQACAEVYDRAWQAALAAAAEAGGTLSHHHGVGRSKAPRLRAELGAVVDVVRASMHAFDPHGIMNAGNLIPPPGDTTAQAHVGELGFSIDPTSLLACLPGDMTLREAAVRLEGSGFVLPVSGGIPDVSVDAWIAAGAKGSADPWDDPVDHLLAGLRAELPSGRRIALPPSPRRAVGPDVISLFFGQNGRFGKIRAADVRVLRRSDPKAPALPYGGPRNPPLTSGEETLLARLSDAISAIPRS
jgi:alkyldihydroxyacetonephosphate synthase